MGNRKGLRRRTQSLRTGDDGLRTEGSRRDTGGPFSALGLLGGDGAWPFGNDLGVCISMGRPPWPDLFWLV